MKKITKKWRELNEARNRICRIVNTRDCAEDVSPDYWKDRLEVALGGLEKMSAMELDALNTLLFCFDGRVKSVIRHESVRETS